MMIYNAFGRIRSATTAVRNTLARLCTLIKKKCLVIMCSHQALYHVNFRKQSYSLYHIIPTHESVSQKNLDVSPTLLPTSSIEVTVVGIFHFRLNTATSIFTEHIRYSTSVNGWELLINLTNCNTKLR